MTKKDLARRIADEVGIPQLNVLEVIQMLFNGITNVLVNEGNIELRDFGVFKVKESKARKARNPRTGAAVIVPARRRVTFKPGREMQKKVRES